jgi:formate hydrogenlyase transcriptional activator
LGLARPGEQPTHNRPISREDICHIDYHYLFEQFRKETKEKGEFSGESKDLRKDGSMFMAEIRGTEFLYKEKKHVLSLIRDITQRKKAEETLHRAFEEMNRLKEQLETENKFLREEMEVKYQYEEIVGHSDAIVNAFKQIERVADTDTTVFLLGETGTGKELFARAIHNLSARKNRPMVKVNCAALPGTLIESELFGKEKGAFTGADATQIGRFEAADGGTIFLDEITEVPPAIQVKLLRVLQECQFERLGSTRTITVDVRVIAASNRDITGALQNGNFREDLYYRLNVFPVLVPPLRNRREDIPDLVWSFVKTFEKTLGKRIDKVHPKGMMELQQHSWPGNIRELRNVVERAMILCNGPILQLMPPTASSRHLSANLTLAEVEKRHILEVLEKTGWRVRGKQCAAEILGLKPTTLDYRIKKLGIPRLPNAYKNL